MERGSRSGRRIALHVQYDGTHFIGFQVQNEGRSVQRDIENALKILTREDVRVIPSGRTDAGVHALAQIVHFNTGSDISLNRLCVGLNGIMDKDISVRNVYEVHNDFHARFSAVSREYRYYIYNNPQRTPFMAYRAMWVHVPLEINYMQQAFSYLIGEHDFASFCKKQSVEHGTVRRIELINVRAIDDYYEVVIKGNAFLHNMIRIIIGTVVDMARNKEKPEKMREIMDACDRDAGGHTASPCGLYLYRIVYDPPLSEYESAF